MNWLRYSGLMRFVPGSGTILGPLFAGWLILVFSEARLSPLPVGTLMVVLGVVNVGVAFLFKETNPKDEPVELKEIAQKGVNTLKVVSLWKQLADADEEIPGLKPLFLLNILATLGMGYYAFFVAFLTKGEFIMTPHETVQFFTYFGGLALAANLIFFTYIARHVNKRKVILFLASLSVVLQLLYAFSESTVTLLYIVAGVDAITVSILMGITGSLLSVMIKEGNSQGEMFGNIQGLGGLATFSTALVNSLLSGVNMKAPFFFGDLSMAWPRS